MRILVTADLHLTDNPADAYRWEFMRWLMGVLKHNTHLVILGDLTDKKDNHSAKLVHDVVEWVATASMIVPVYILMGNHDYTKRDCPFFGFLSKLRNVEYIASPTEVEFGDETAMFLPHMRDKEFELTLYKLAMGQDYMFMHQTVKDSRVESGAKVGSIPGKLFENVRGTIYSGDVHVPQTVGKVNYIGAPYPIRFGDDYKPRVRLLLSGGLVREYHPPTIKKSVIDLHMGDGIGISLKRGDQAKFRIHLRRADFASWPEIRREVLLACQKVGVYAASIELVEEKTRQRLADLKKATARRPKEFYAEYCKSAKARYRKTGERLLENVK